MEKKEGSDQDCKGYGPQPPSQSTVTSHKPSWQCSARRYRKNYDVLAQEPRLLATQGLPQHIVVLQKHSAVTVATLSRKPTWAHLCGPKRHLL